VEVLPGIDLEDQGAPALSRQGAPQGGGHDGLADAALAGHHDELAARELFDHIHAIPPLQVLCRRAA
jgi:hypothetical protein